MGKFVMILKHSPYHTISASLAVRHALETNAGAQDMALVLISGGVLLAKKGQHDEWTGFTNLEGALRDSIATGMSVYAESESLERHRLDHEDVIDGVRVVNAHELARLLQRARSSIFF